MIYTVEVGVCMSSTVFLSLGSFFYMVLISIVYFTKPKLKTLENKIYKGLIVISLSSLNTSKKAALPAITTDTAAFFCVKYSSEPSACIICSQRNYRF